jgi:tRNA(adenine34) deaminase
MIFDDQFYMHKALELAEIAAAQGEVPVGAVVVLDGEIIGQGWNQPIGTRDPTAHAEIIALRNAAQNLANYRLPGASLYVTIEPCTMCAGAMVHARIQRLVYGALEPKSGVAESNGCVFSGGHLNHRLEVVGGVLSERCSEQMSAFFKRRRLLGKTARDEPV